MRFIISAKRATFVRSNKIRAKLTVKVDPHNGKYFFNLKKLEQFQNPLNGN